MMIKQGLASVALGLALLWGGAAQAALAAVTLGNHNQAAATTNVLTTVTNDCPVGSLIFILTAYTTVADTLVSVTDSAGNTWQTPIDNVTGTGIGIGVGYAKNSTVDLPIGGTITATFGGSVTTSVVGVCISGAATTTPLDIHNINTTGLAATSATTLNSGTLNNSVELVIGVFGTASTASSPTCNGSFGGGFQLNGIPSAKICALAVASTASVAFTPSWTNVNNYASDMLSFSASDIGGLSNQPLPLLGVSSNDNQPFPAPLASLEATR